MKSTNLLIQEHKLILRALDVLDAISASIDSDATLAAESDIDMLLDFLRWFADAHHQAKEEMILFPALKTAAAAQDRPVQHLMLEHRQERLLIEDLEKSLRLGELSDFASCANHLSSTLRNHVYKEDRILFEAADSILSPEEDDAVFEQLTGFETPLDKQVIEKKLAELRSLEWKYLRRLNVIG